MAAGRCLTSIFILSVSLKVSCVTLTSPSMDANGRNESCLGEIVTFQCDISGTTQHVWRISFQNITANLALASRTVVEEPFTFNVRNEGIDNNRVVNITTTATVIAAEQINGTTVSCEDRTLVSPDPNPPQRHITVLDISVRIPNQPQQIDFNAVELPVELIDQAGGRMCAGEFEVTAVGSSCVTGSTETTQPTVVRGATSPILVDGLNLCKFVYSFTALFRNGPFTGGNDTNMSFDTNFDFFGQVVVMYFAENGSLIWTPPSNASSVCVDQYSITIRDSPNNVIQTMNATSTSLSICEVDGIPSCVRLTATVTPSVPCRGFLKDSSSDEISVHCQPSGLTGLIQSFAASTECLKINAKVVLDTSVVCQADELSLMIRVDTSDGTRSPDQLNVLGTCENTKALLYTCTVPIKANSYGAGYRMTAEVMAGNDVIGTRTLSDPDPLPDYCQCNQSVCGGVPVALIIVVAVPLVIVILCMCIKHKNKSDHNIIDKEEAHELKDQIDDSNIDHEKGPAGDEYAVVEKKPKNAIEVTSQCVYQDPNTIEHEQGPETGDLYAVTEKKPKKKSNKADEKADVEVAAMYSVPDKSKKAQITYADIDMAVPRGDDDKPMHQPPLTEYATVVN